MSPRHWKTRIEDIESIHNIQGYVKGMSFKEFAQDAKTVRAVAYEIVTLGEAARHIPPELQGGA